MPLYNCYTEGHLSFGVTYLKCNGTEEQIFGCVNHQHNIQSSHEDAGLICQSKYIMLLNFIILNFLAIRFNNTV